MLFYGTLLSILMGSIFGCLCAPFVEAIFGLIPDYSVYAANTHTELGVVGCVGARLAMIAMFLMIMIIAVMPEFGYKLPDRPLTRGWVLAGVICGIAFGVTAKMARSLTISQEIAVVPLFASIILCLLATGVIFEIPGIIRRRLGK